MDEYFERFGGVRDYLRSVVQQGDARTDTRRPSLAVGATCRTSPRPTASAGTSPSESRSTRPSRAVRPTSSSVRCLRSTRDFRTKASRHDRYLQVHDELVVEVAPGERDAVEAILRDEMSGAADLSVPLDVNVGVGANWRTAGH